MFNYELVSCPVPGCGKLGKRNKGECYIVKCANCNTLWMWTKGAKEPKVIKSIPGANKCTCEGCKYRDSR